MYISKKVRKNMLKCVVIYNPNSGKLTNRSNLKKIYKILENYEYDTELIIVKEEVNS